MKSFPRDLELFGDESRPDGERWPYRSHAFPTDADYCETFGHDLITGAVITPEKYRANNPAGRAFLKPAEYVPPSEEPDKDYPFFLTTGRLVYHFHTRTKTGRAEKLRSASPDGSLQMAATDAEALAIKEGDWVRITSRRASIEAPATIGDIAPGHLFIPFHFGYWDNPHHARAANELTLFEWDAVSKQPHFKYAAVKLEKISEPSLPQDEKVNLQPDQDKNSISNLAEQVGALAGNVLGAIKNTIKPERSHLADYIGLLDESERRLVKSFTQIRDSHADEPDINAICKLFAEWSQEAQFSLKPFIAKYGERRKNEPKRLDDALSVKRSHGAFDLLRDLHDLWLLVNESMMSLNILGQGARGLRDEELLDVLKDMQDRNGRQRDWLQTRINQAAPQVLTVPI